MVQHIIGLKHSQDATYTAWEIPGVLTPGLLGMKSLRRHRVILDLIGNQMVTVGPGATSWNLSPGPRSSTSRKVRKDTCCFPAPSSPG